MDDIKKRDQDALEKMKKEEEAGKQRQKELADKLNQEKKNKEKANFDALPINEMPDCPEKYQKIMKEFTGGKKYEDPKFPANETTLGSELTNYVDSWKRVEGHSIFGEGFSTTDPRQGMIGDCYFISAMTVAGKTNVEGAMLIGKLNQSSDCGAYIVRFFFQGEPVEVIVDDRLPVDAAGDIAFCKSDIGTKLWPAIIEKAYAKLHGGYDKIVGGKVNYALNELTGGYPEEIKLAVAQKNLDTLWETLIDYTKQGYLLGAGSPENPAGDSAISQEGIVQGHAYSILHVEQYEGQRLIQLRNPHGSGGAEWTGDWGDSSTKWTDKAKKILKMESKEDGVFWMSLDDFAFEFKSVYVCRTFDPKIWKTCPTLEGEWKGDTAAGLPTKKNPSADMSKNPHYTIKVNKRCTVFIALTQLDRRDMFRGNKPIMFMVQKNGAKRISSTSADLLVGNSGAPIDSLTVSTQMTFDASSFPYTFTLMVASSNAGAEGEGKYLLNIYCTEDFTINKM